VQAFVPSQSGSSQTRTVDPLRRGLSPAAVVVGLSAVVVLLLIFPLVRASHSSAIDFGEGWNAYEATRAMSGQPLYPPRGSLSPNSYPPLSFYGIAGVALVTGVDPWKLGRLLALLALVGLSWQAGWVARRCGASWVAAVSAALTFIGLVAVAAPRYIAMDDPQMLAMFIAGFAVMLYVSGSTVSRRLGVPLTAAVVVLALFTKHNLVDLPIAIAIDLAIAAPLLAARWIMYVGVFAVAGIGLSSMGAHEHFIANMSLGRRYDWPDLERSATLGLLAVSVPAALGFWGYRRGPRDRGRHFLFLLLITSLVLATAFAGGSGTDVNMYFTAFWAASVLAALAIDTLPAVGVWRAAVPAVLAIWFAASLPLRAPTAARLRTLTQRDADTASDVAFLRAQPGGAYCEQMILCYRGEKPLLVQPYFAPELIATRVVDEQTVARLFEAQTFGVLQLDGVLEADAAVAHSTPAPTAFRLPREVLDAIGRSYRLAYTSSNGAFYVPR
jgi:hypothetical protein